MRPGADDIDGAEARRVLAGDIEAFSGIVERWQRPLVNLAYRFCRNQAQAEDMAQEAFIRAFRHLDQWRGDAAFSTWLFSLALNVFRTSLRRTPQHEEPSADLATVPAPGSPAQDVADRRAAETVRRAVLTLPRQYREALILFYFMERSLNEAAQCLGVPEGTLKARLHRGRALLKAKLERSFDHASGATR